ncbi:MAG: hypothetical protein HY892_22790 [Deltaproteobacteria bacterium]|nr:hypothetical protein [Deltaproteobacteria bacterium]
MLKYLVAILAFTAMLWPVTVPAQTKCNLSHAWSATTYDEKECLEHAEHALRKTGYYKNFSATKQSVFGYNEDNEHASIRCLPTKGVVFFIISGSGSLSDHVERLKRNF